MKQRFESFSDDRFRSHDDRRSVKRSSERSWLRKVQVHPNNTQPMEYNQNDHDASHLFNVTNSPKPKISSSTENLQQKSSFSRLPSTMRSFVLPESSLRLFDTRPTSNVIKIHNTGRLSVCPPTPCMFGYRQKSLPTLVPTLVPTRIIKYPRSFDDSLKQFDIDYLDI